MEKKERPSITFIKQDRQDFFTITWDEADMTWDQAEFSWEGLETKVRPSISFTKQNRP